MVKIFKQITIKRRISKILKTNLNELYFDLESPYGYSGFETNTTDQKFLNEAFRQYKKFISSFDNVISEFIRFHPFSNSHEILANELDYLKLNRKTVYVNLNQNYDDIYKNYKKSLKRNLKKQSPIILFTVVNH